MKRLMVRLILLLPFGQRLFPLLKRLYRSAKRLFSGFRKPDLRDNLLQLGQTLADQGDLEQALLHSARFLRAQRGAGPNRDRLAPGHGSDTAEQHQLFIEAHDLLAEDAINRRGDFDTALSIYRRKRQSQGQFAERYGLAGLRVLFLPPDWVRNIGHMALLDFWVKMKHLGWGSWDHLILLAPPNATANAAYLHHWRQHFTVVTDPHLVNALTPFAAALGNRVAGLLSLPEGKDCYFADGLGVIQNEWDRQGRSPLLALTSDEREHGQETLARLGLPANAWFVCLHVRTPSFYQEGAAPYQAHRNADIGSFLPAIQAIVNRGGWVIRLGDPGMEPVPPLPGLIDYAHSSLKSPEMDVFLCASCRFFIGVASGLSHVPATFGVPSILTNWVSSPFPVCGSQALFIPKLLWSEDEQRYLRFEESLKPGVARLSYCGEKLPERNLRAVENTPDEIVALIEEMFKMFEGDLTDPPLEDQLQRAFRELAGRHGQVGFSRIGQAFLRKYAHLVPSQRAKEARAA